MDVDPAEGRTTSCEGAGTSPFRRDTPGLFLGTCESVPCRSSSSPPASDLGDTLDFEDDDDVNAQDRPKDHQSGRVSSAPLDKPPSRGDSEASSDPRHGSPTHASHAASWVIQRTPSDTHEGDLCHNEMTLDLDEPDCAMTEANCALSSRASSADNTSSDSAGVPCVLDEVTLPVHCDSLPVSSDALPVSGRALSADVVDFPIHHSSALTHHYSTLTPPSNVLASRLSALTPRLSALTPPLNSLTPPLSGPGLALNVATSRIDDARQGSCAALPGFDEGALLPERRVLCSQGGVRCPERGTVHLVKGVMDPKDALCADSKRGSAHWVQYSPLSPQDDIWSDNDLEVLTVVVEAGQPRLGASSAELKAGEQALGWEADLVGNMLHLTDDALDLSDDAVFHEKDESDREQGRWRLGGETAGSSIVLWQPRVFSHDEGLLSDSDDDLR